MSYSPEVKARAQALDPECWRSYAGRPLEFKRRMEIRRANALRRAAQEFAAKEPSLVRQLEERIRKLEARVEALEFGSLRVGEL